MEIKIRKMKAEDAMAVASMNELLCHSPDKPSRAAIQFFETYGMGPDKLATIWVAHDDGRLAGFAATRDWASFGAKIKVRQIDLLYVEEEYRGMGIAADFLAHVKADAFEKGCGRIDIQTEASNEDSNALYKKFGFEAKPDTRNFYQLYLDQ